MKFELNASDRLGGTEFLEPLIKPALIVFAARIGDHRDDFRAGLRSVS
jgi:hypothetical protein